MSSRAERSAHRRLTAGWVLPALLLIFGAGCDEQLSFFGGKSPAASKIKAENGGVSVDKDEWSSVPVPPADGPALAPLAFIVPIYPKPDKKSDAVGYLRVGARVARSREPVSRNDCPDGWYAIRPVGFVCAGADATTKLDNPIARALHVEPDRRNPMPYKYAFVRAIAPNYLRVPTKNEQFQYEMRLERHLRNWNRLREHWDDLDVGANDVPIDEAGLATGKIPDAAKPMNQSERFGGNGDDTVPWWLEGERRIPNLSSYRAPPYAVIASRVRRHAGVALIGTFVADERANGRRFAVTTDARLIPADKLKADSGSPFHGGSIRESGLPVAFPYARDATWWDVRGNEIERGERVGFRELVPLTGTVKMIRGVRMVEARNGKWLRSSDLKTAAKPSSLPSWAKRGTKWIDIAIVSQTMVLWEGDQPVYATLVSTGKGGLGEPGKTLSTPRGTFRVTQKHVTTTMDSDVADHEFELRDVPWVQYFKGGYALHAAYWHDDFGKVRSHGCVNVSPIDARYTFLWTTPQVPEHWQAAYVGGVTEPGTIVNIHP
ncbi:MAG: L,D-transpeptidase [Sorangiineae bacterium]|nr:L,D-transpeptidase [Polyangiaceae bacterium]MEB2321980.1 L,D-transpeptidase [Sorangiineae bacterium]